MTVCTASSAVDAVSEARAPGPQRGLDGGADGRILLGRVPAAAQRPSAAVDDQQDRVEPAPRAHHAPSAWR